MDRYGGYHGFGGFMGSGKNPFNKEKEEKETSSDEFIRNTESEDEKFFVNSTENAIDVSN